MRQVSTPSLSIFRYLPLFIISTQCNELVIIKLIEYFKCDKLIRSSCQQPFIFLYKFLMQLFGFVLVSNIYQNSQVQLSFTNYFTHVLGFKVIRNIAEMPFIFFSCAYAYLLGPILIRNKVKNFCITFSISSWFLHWSVI